MSFAIENEKLNRMFFLDAQIREDKTSLLSTINLPVVEFIHILAAFYRLHINLVLFKHSLDASKYVQVGLNYTLNYFFKNKISNQMATLSISTKNFINVSKDLWIAYT